MYYNQFGMAIKPSHVVVEYHYAELERMAQRVLSILLDTDVYVRILSDEYLNVYFEIDAPNHIIKTLEKAGYTPNEPSIFTGEILHLLFESANVGSTFGEDEKEDYVFLSIPFDDYIKKVHGIS